MMNNNPIYSHVYLAAIPGQNSHETHMFIMFPADQIFQKMDLNSGKVWKGTG